MTFVLGWASQGQEFSKRGADENIMKIDRFFCCHYMMDDKADGTKISYFCKMLNSADTGVKNQEFFSKKNVYSLKKTK